MKTLLLAATASLALAAGGAQAQDYDTNFAGLYVGAHLGGSVPENHKDETVRFDRDLDGTYGGTADTFANFSPGFSGGAANGTTQNAGVDSDDESVPAGIRLGYDAQYGRLVLGVVGEAEVNKISDSVSAYSTTPASYTFTRELESVAAIRARVGYVWNRYLPYLTAGVAKADVNHTFTTSNVTNTFTDRDGGSLDGYQLGAGVETKIGNVSVGVEYIYTNLDDQDYTVRASGGAVGGPFTLVNATGTDLRRSEDFDYHALRGTVAMRF